MIQSVPVSGPDPDEWRLGFEESQAPYESSGQLARVWTETWVHRHSYCPHCGCYSLSKHHNNNPAADFYCAECGEDYELKSKKGKFGSRIVDGAYSAMRDRLENNRAPNLALMQYDAAKLSVVNFVIVPKQFFVREVIEERKPLAAHARRAGWVGCNIHLGRIPESGKVYLLRDGRPEPKSSVLASWHRTIFLRQAKQASRGWLTQVLRCCESIGSTEFFLEDVYRYESQLSSLYPGNNNVKPKIRQQLQVLRDQGLLEFLGEGRYRLTAKV